MPRNSISLAALPRRMGPTEQRFHVASGFGGKVLCRRESFPNRSLGLAASGGDMRICTVNHDIHTKNLTSMMG